MTMRIKGAAAASAIGFFLSVTAPILAQTPTPTPNPMGVTARGEAYTSRAFLGEAPLGTAPLDLFIANTDCDPDPVPDDTDGDNVCVASEDDSDALPDCFAETAAGETVDAAPIAVVDGGDSSTDAETDATAPACMRPTPTPIPAGTPTPTPTTVPFVSSVGGGAVASALIDPSAPGGVVLEAVTQGASVLITCDGLEVASEVNLLEIGGTPVPIPGDMPFTIVEGLAIIDANRRTINVIAPPGGTTGTVSAEALALRVQLVTEGELLDLRLSFAHGVLANLPLSCPVFSLVILDNSNKQATIVDDDGDGQVDGGETVRFTVNATNSGADDAQTMQIVDRLPANGTLVADSVTLDGSPVAGAVANCPGDVSFEGCPGEPPIDTDRQCLTVQGGDLPAGTTKALAFDVMANDGAGFCNTAKISAVDPDDGSTVVVERSVVVTGAGGGTPTPTATGGTPTPIPTGGTPTPTGPTPTATRGAGADRLITTGGGGCAIGPSGPAIDVAGVLALLALVALRRRFRKL